MEQGVCRGWLGTRDRGATGTVHGEAAVAYPTAANRMGCHHAGDGEEDGNQRVLHLPELLDV